MPVFESSRKVQVFGSSLAMTLPALFVKANEVEKGSVGKVYYGLEGVLVISLVDDPKARAGLIEIIERLNKNCMKEIEGEGQVECQVVRLSESSSLGARGGGSCPSRIISRSA